MKTDNPVVYVDLDDTLNQYSQLFNERVTACPDIKYPQSQFGFFLDIDVMPEAQKSLRSLKGLGFEVYILTAPSIYNPLSYTEKRVWVERHFGFEMVEKLIICNNKGLLRGDFLIDDQIAGRGQEFFKGQIIQFGTEPFKNWHDVMSYFSTLGSS
jgi:5'(3')-deoxyribonucleotidase